MRGVKSKMGVYKQKLGKNMGWFGRYNRKSAHTRRKLFLDITNRVQATKPMRPIQMFSLYVPRK